MLFVPLSGVSRQPILSTEDCRAIMDGKALPFDFDPDLEHSMIDGPADGPYILVEGLGMFIEEAPVPEWLMAL